MQNSANQSTTPRNINAARRVANSWEKALRLTEDGYRFVTCTLPNSPAALIAVYKPNDAPAAPSYWLREGFTAPEMPNGCSCPDFTRHGDYCKHTLCWEDMRIEAAQIAQYEAQEADAECAQGVDYLL